MMPEPKWQDPAPLEMAFVHLMQEIAQRFTPKKQTPDWVREVLIYFTWQLGSVWSISEMQKASSEASEWAIEIEGLADQLGKALERGWHFQYLDTNDLFNSKTLSEIHSSLRATLQIANAIKLITSPNGTVRKGSSKQHPHNWIPPRQVCAVVVSEIWAYFNQGRVPSPYNQRAAAIAEALYTAISLKQRHMVQDPHSKWRLYFKRLDLEELKSLRQNVKWLVTTLSNQEITVK